MAFILFILTVIVTVILFSHVNCQMVVFWNDPMNNLDQWTDSNAAVITSPNCPNATCVIISGLSSYMTHYMIHDLTSTVGYENIYLEYDIRIALMEPGDFLLIFYSVNNAKLKLTTYHDSTSVVLLGQQLLLPSECNNATFLRIGFLNNGTESQDVVYVDNVKLYGSIIHPPSVQPTKSPTKLPTEFPTNLPTLPTKLPTNLPTNLPTKIPTNVPTKLPTNSPTNIPTDLPTTVSPTYLPSTLPSALPTLNPTTKPTIQPILNPTLNPTLTETTLKSRHLSSTYTTHYGSETVVANHVSDDSSMPIPMEVIVVVVVGVIGMMFFASCWLCLCICHYFSRRKTEMINNMVTDTINMDGTSGSKQQTSIHGESTTKKQHTIEMTDGDTINNKHSEQTQTNDEPSSDGTTESTTSTTQESSSASSTINNRTGFDVNHVNAVIQMNKDIVQNNVQISTNNLYAAYVIGDNNIEYQQHVHEKHRISTTHASDVTLPAVPIV